MFCSFSSLTFVLASEVAIYLDLRFSYINHLPRQRFKKHATYNGWNFFSHPNLFCSYIRLPFVCASSIVTSGLVIMLHIICITCWLKSMFYEFRLDNFSGLNIFCSLISHTFVRGCWCRIWSVYSVIFQMQSCLWKVCSLNCFKQNITHESNLPSYKSHISPWN